MGACHPVKMKGASSSLVGSTSSYTPMELGGEGAMTGGPFPFLEKQLDFVYSLP